MNNTQLVHKKYTLGKANRITGVSILGAVAVASVVATIATALPFAIAVIPAIIGSFLTLTNGIDSSAKWRYFENVTSHRDPHVNDQRRYPALFESDYHTWKAKQTELNRFAIAKAMLSKTPATFVIDSKKTDEHGGRIDTVVEISGFLMSVKDKVHQSDIQMWSSAWENAKYLK